MGASELKDTLRPPSTASMDESATSTVAQSHEPSVMEKAEAAALEPEDEKKDVPDQLADAAEEPEVNEKALDGTLDRAVSTVSTEAEEYPGTAKLAIISLALCLSVFCIALVRIRILTIFRSAATNYIQGQYHHCHCNSSHHRSVSRTQ